MKSVLTLLPFVAILCSCGSGLDFEAGSAPAKGYRNVVVRDFKYNVEDTPEGAYTSKDYPNLIASEIRKTGAFTGITRNGKVSGDTLVIDGKITAYSGGLTALRAFVGVGTGKAHFYNEVNFTDGVTGKSLGKLTVEKSSRTGLAGISQDINFLIQSSSEGVAEQAKTFSATSR